MALCTPDSGKDRVAVGKGMGLTTFLAAHAVEAGINLMLWRKPDFGVLIKL